MVDTGFCVNPHPYEWIAGSWLAGVRSGVAVIRFYIRLAGIHIYVGVERNLCRRFRVECFRRDESTDQYKYGETNYEGHCLEICEKGLWTFHGGFRIGTRRL